MDHEPHITEDELFNLTEDERMAFAQMTDEEINAYWQAQQSYEAMQAYVEHPATPEVARSIVDLSGWQAHKR